MCSSVGARKSFFFTLILMTALTLVAATLVGCGSKEFVRGTVDACLVHPRDVIRFLCHTNASSFIVAHNHPSGDPKPSHQDWTFTRRLIQCGQLVEIPLLDHVIVTTKTHTSLAALRPGLFEFTNFNERRLD